MNGSIVFVCTANICRSVLMHYTFLNSMPTIGELDVTSAGVSAREGKSPCELALSLIPAGPARAVAGSHRSIPIDDSQLEADIIIVASRTERSALARRSPGARQKLFTLTEAVLLGRFALDQRPSRAMEIRNTQEYAQLLDANRGRIVIPRPKPKRWSLRSSDDVNLLDIPDAHHERHQVHERILKQVRSEITEFSSQLAAQAGLDDVNDLSRRRFEIA